MAQPGERCQAKTAVGISRKQTWVTLSESWGGQDSAHTKEGHPCRHCLLSRRSGSVNATPPGGGAPGECHPGVSAPRDLAEDGLQVATAVGGGSRGSHATPGAPSLPRVCADPVSRVFPILSTWTHAKKGCPTDPAVASAACVPDCPASSPRTPPNRRRGRRGCRHRPDTARWR